MWKGIKMKLLKNGRLISVSIENITPTGIWIFIRGKEYFLDYETYPWFKEKTLSKIQNVQLLHDVHIYWPDLDIDLELDCLENPEKYPLKYKPV